MAFRVKLAPSRAELLDQTFWRSDQSEGFPSSTAEAFPPRASRHVKNIVEEMQQGFC